MLGACCAARLAVSILGLSKEEFLVLVTNFAHQSTKKMVTHMHFEDMDTAVKTARVVFPPCSEETGLPHSRRSLGERGNAERKIADVVVDKKRSNKRAARNRLTFSKKYFNSNKMAAEVSNGWIVEIIINKKSSGSGTKNTCSCGGRNRREIENRVRI